MLSEFPYRALLFPCQVEVQIHLSNIWHNEVEVEIMTDGQSASLSRCQVPIWSLGPGFSFLTLADFLMWGALSDESLVGAVTLKFKSPRPHDLILISHSRLP
jgi:hypothetical protein